MKRMMITMFAITITAAAVRPADAGLVIRAQVQALDPSARGGDMTMYFEDGRFRVDYESKRERQFLIVQGEGKDAVLWMVDDSNSQYRELKGKDVEKVRNKVADQLDSFESQIKGMPQSEREQVLAQYGDQLQEMRDIVYLRDDTRLVFENNDEPSKIGEWDTERYTVYYDEVLDKKYEVASWGDVGMMQDDFRSLIDATVTFGTFAGDWTFVSMWEEGGIDGFPVKITSYKKGEKFDIVTVQSVTRQDIDPYMWKIPKGINEVPMME